jgi:hypothetical protein
MIRRRIDPSPRVEEHVLRRRGGRRRTTAPGEREPEDEARGHRGTTERPNASSRPGEHSRTIATPPGDAEN